MCVIFGREDTNSGGAFDWCTHLRVNILRGVDRTHDAGMLRAAAASTISVKH